jgi:hypothetical protein
MDLPIDDPERKIHTRCLVPLANIFNHSGDAKIPSNGVDRETGDVCIWANQRYWKGDEVIKNFFFLFFFFFFLFIKLTPFFFLAFNFVWTE